MMLSAGQRARASSKNGLRFHDSWLRPNIVWQLWLR
jgi:hypothetical protein